MVTTKTRRHEEAHNIESGADHLDFQRAYSADVGCRYEDGDWVFFVSS